MEVPRDAMKGGNTGPRRPGMVRVPERCEGARNFGASIHALPFSGAGPIPNEAFLDRHPQLYRYPRVAANRPVRRIGPRPANQTRQRGGVRNETARGPGGDLPTLKTRAVVIPGGSIRRGLFAFGDSADPVAELA